VPEVPGMIMRRKKAIALMVPLLVALSACTPGRQNAPEMIRTQSAIHERLSEAIIRDGFDYDFGTERDGSEHLDVIRVKFSLDSLKGRHLSLEKLITDIGRICSHPNYAHLPVRIRIGAGDEDDQMYVFAILATALRGRDNIALMPVTDLRNEIIITVRHPASGGN
jgi:hypothetical protein